jgi:cell division septation protein DedD
MNQEIFADAISAVHVTGNLVRIDLMTVQPHLKSDNGQPVVDISKRIIMPLEGFIQSLAVQDNIVKQLVEAGVLKRNSNAETPAQEPAQALTLTPKLTLTPEPALTPASASAPAPESEPELTQASAPEPTPEPEPTPTPTIAIEDLHKTVDLKAVNLENKISEISPA